MAKTKIDIDSLRAKAENDAANLRTLAEWLLTESREKNLDERVEYTQRVAVLRATAEAIVAYASVSDTGGLGRILGAFVPHGKWAATVLLGALSLSADLEGVLALEERVRLSDQPHLADCVAVLETDIEDWQRLGVEFAPEVLDASGEPTPEVPHADVLLRESYIGFLTETLQGTGFEFNAVDIEEPRFQVFSEEFGDAATIKFHKIAMSEPQEVELELLGDKADEVPGRRVFNQPELREMLRSLFENS